MKDLTKVFIDLSKCSEEQRKHVISLLPEPYWNGPDMYNAPYCKHIKYSSDHKSLVIGLFSKDTRLKELTYPEFIKLFEGGETIKSDNTKTLQNALKQIEKMEADKAELLEALEKVKRLEPIICMGGAVAEQWQNEAQALNEMTSEIESLIQKMKQ